MEQVPDPRNSGVWIPCSDPPAAAAADPDPHAVQRALSCIARDNRLFVVANVATLQPCDAAADAACPDDGRYQYNTNVAYDPTGRLVARYRKYNLFMAETRVYDRPRTAELVHFDTPFGGVGTFTCFDVIFQRPAMALAETGNVSHVAFPTAWSNELPYYAAGPFHQGFAAAAGVNVIAANIHLPARELCGSGVYGWDGVPRAFRCTDDTSSALIVAEIPTEVPDTRAETGPQQSFPPSDLEGGADFSGSVFEDPFNFVHLRRDTDVISVCHNGLCCRLNYTRRPQGGNDDQLVLGAFRGLHTYEGQYYLEVCLLMTCLDVSETFCGEDATTSTTFFSYLELSGSFSTKYVYPQVVTAGVRPSTDVWEFKRGVGTLVLPRATSSPLLSATLYGRRFDLDDGAPEQPSAGRTQHRASQLFRAIIIAIAVIMDYP